MPTKLFPPIIGLQVISCNHRIRNGALYYGKSGPIVSEYFSLLLVLDGKIEVKTTRFACAASKGCVALWEPDTPTLLKALPGRRPPSYYMLLFSPCAANGKVSTLEDIGLDPFYQIRNTGHLSLMLEKMVRLSNGNDKNRALKCSILGLQLLLALKPFPSSFRQNPHLPDNRDPDERMETALAYLHRNYKKRIAVETLAQLVSMQYLKFISAFKESTGVTPHQYLLNLKIEKAKDFMIFYRESPVHTAHELGFHDYAHFARAFRRITGMNPKDFRNQFKERI